MARSKNKSKAHKPTTVRTPRDHNTIATRSVRAFTPSLTPTVSVGEPRRGSMREVEDRREFHFDAPGRPALKVSGRPSHMKLADRKKRHVTSSGKPVALHGSGPLQTKAVRAFEAPKKVVVCVRRAVRRAVIMASTGGGKITRRKPRRNSTSGIRC